MDVPRAESAGDLIRTCGLEWKYDGGVQRLRAAHAGDFYLRWERRWECDDVRVSAWRVERDEHAGDSTERCRATSKHCEARHERCEEGDAEATADAPLLHRGAVSSEGANRRPKRDGN
jgi:hypothetical protein